MKMSIGLKGNLEIGYVIALINKSMLILKKQLWFDKVEFIKNYEKKKNRKYKNLVLLRDWWG